MGWYYTNGPTRKELISELSEGRIRTSDQGVTITTTCLASCYRGGVFSGTLWSVWQRTFSISGTQASPNQRWIKCDLMRCDNGLWGHKPLEESMHPYHYSCPLGYLAKVPLEEFGGNAEWREGVQSYHKRQAERRQQKRLAVK
jgi:hypothetical protein